MTSTAKQAEVLDATGLKRAPLETLIKDGQIDRQPAEALLTAM